MQGERNSIELHANFYEGFCDNLSFRAAASSRFCLSSFSGSIDLQYDYKSGLFLGDTRSYMQWNLNLSLLL